MSLVVNETDALEFILTQYGLDRIAEAMSSQTVTLNISKIKVGDANGEYYEPTLTEFKEYNSNLRHLITGGSFYITDKNLLEDNLTVSFRAIIPENFSNCEIREVGLYETVNEEDFLFAVSTQQPLLKPSTELGYLMSVDYYAFLKSANLASVYEQIVLDPDNQLVTQDKLESLMSTILFTDSNLMEQVNSNTRVIGLNRNEQLYNLVVEEQKNFGYITTYNNCASILNYIDTDNLYAYWIFDYPRRIGGAAEIVDIGPKGRNLSTNAVVNAYDRTYQGFASFLNFKNPNYYYMNQSATELVYTSADFTMVPTLNNQVQISSDGIATNFNTTNYIQTATLDTSKNFQIELMYSTGTSSTATTLFADANGAVEILITANNTIGAAVKNSNGVVKQLTSSLKVNDNTWRYVRLSKNSTGVTLESSVDRETWTQLDSETMDTFSTSAVTYIGRNATGTTSFPGTLDLKHFVMKVNGVQVASGGREEVANELTFLNSNRTADAPVTLAFTVEPTGTGKRTLLARSNYYSNSHYFEVNETADNKVEVILFADSSNYMTFTTGAGTVPTSAHTLIIAYDTEYKTMSMYINGREVGVTKTVTGTYDHMNDRPATLYAYTCTTNRYKYADSSTAPTKLMNEDGSPNIDANWSIQGTSVIYSSNITTYNSTYNKQTDKLYAWTVSDKFAYTKSLTITKDTVLYNSDYSLNTEFQITQSGSNYIVTYNSTAATQDSTSDIPSITLYAFVYTGNLETIWANSNVTPTSLYYYNGDLYDGDKWSVVGGSVYYEDIQAAYTEKYNREVPSVPITSYIINVTGQKAQLVDSKVASIIIIKELLNDSELRSLALLLEATRGQNPCIYTV